MDAIEEAQRKLERYKDFLENKENQTLKDFFNEVHRRYRQAQQFLESFECGDSVKLKDTLVLIQREVKVLKEIILIPKQWEREFLEAQNDLEESKNQTSALKE